MVYACSCRAWNALTVVAGSGCFGCRAQLQEATAAAQASQEQQACAAAAGQHAQQAAAEVAAKHKVANKAKAEADKLAAQASRLKEAGRLDEAKKAQIQAKRCPILQCLLRGSAHAQSLNSYRAA